MQKLKSLKNVINNLNKIALDVGYFGGKKHDENDLTLGTIAKINEYGSIEKKIPPRPFIRATLRRNHNFTRDLRCTLAFSLKNRNNVTKYFKKFGINVMQEVQLEITRGEFARNAESTIAKKKSSKPLIDSGQLRREISWRIKEK